VVAVVVLGILALSALVGLAVVVLVLLMVLLLVFRELLIQEAAAAEGVELLALQVPQVIAVAAAPALSSSRSINKRSHER